MRNNTKRTALAFLSGTALATAMTVAGTTGAYAFTERLEVLFNHVLECKIMLLTSDPDRVGVCGPFNVQPSLDTLVPSAGDVPAAVTTSKPECKPVENARVTVSESQGDGECAPEYETPPS